MRLNPCYARIHEKNISEKTITVGTYYKKQTEKNYANRLKITNYVVTLVGMLSVTVFVSVHKLNLVNMKHTITKFFGDKTALRVSLVVGSLVIVTVIPYTTAAVLDYKATRLKTSDLYKKLDEAIATVYPNNNEDVTISSHTNFLRKIMISLVHHNGAIFGGISGFASFKKDLRAKNYPTDRCLEQDIIDCTLQLVLRDLSAKPEHVLEALAQFMDFDTKDLQTQKDGLKSETLAEDHDAKLLMQAGEKKRTWKQFSQAASQRFFTVMGNIIAGITISDLMKDVNGKDEQQGNAWKVMMILQIYMALWSFLGGTLAGKIILGSFILSSNGLALVWPKIRPLPDKLPGNSKDLCKKMDNKSDGPAPGRDDECKKIIDLIRQGKHVMILGGTGVGKSMVMEQLAYNCRKGVYGPDYKQIKFPVFNSGALLEVKGGFLGGRDVLQEIDELTGYPKDKDNIFIGLEEIQSWKDDPGKIEQAKTKLDSQHEGGFKRVICTSTKDEFDKYIKPNEAFVRRFEQVEIAPLSTEEIEYVLSRMLVQNSIYENTEEKNTIPSKIIESLVNATYINNEGKEVRVIPDEKLLLAAISLVQEFIQSADIEAILSIVSKGPIGDTQQELIKRGERIFRNKMSNPTVYKELDKQNQQTQSDRKKEKRREDKKFDESLSLLHAKKIHDCINKKYSELFLHLYNDNSLRNKKNINKLTLFNKVADRLSKHIEKQKQNLNLIVDLETKINAFILRKEEIIKQNGNKTDIQTSQKEDSNNLMPLLQQQIKLQKEQIERQEKRHTELQQQQTELLAKLVEMIAKLGPADQQEPAAGVI